MSYYYLYYLSVPLSSFLFIKISDKPSCTLDKLKFILFFIFIFQYCYFRDINFTPDYKHYYDFYSNLLEVGYRDSSFKVNEIGWEYLNLIFSNLKISPRIFFSFVSAATVFIYFSSSSYLVDKKFLVLLFIFLTGNYFWMMSGLRQAIAISVFIYSIRYIIKRSLWKYVLTIFIGGLFHVSIYILLPLYFVFGLKFKKRIIAPLFVLSVLFLNNSTVLNLIYSMMNTIVELIPGFQRYAFSLNLGIERDSSRLSSGLGVILNIIISTVILVCIKPIGKKQDFLANLYFLGLILSNIFITVDLVRRLLQYSLFLFPLIASISIDNNEKYSRPQLYFFILCYIMIYSKAVLQFTTPL